MQVRSVVELSKHEICHVRARDHRNHRRGLDGAPVPVGSRMRPIGEAGRPDDGPIQAAPSDDALLCFMVGHDIAQNERATTYLPMGLSGCSCFRPERQETRDRSSGEVRRAPSRGRCFDASHKASGSAFQRRRRAERAQHRVSSRKGALHGTSISDVALHDGQESVLQVELGRCPHQCGNPCASDCVTNARRWRPLRRK